MRRPRGFDGRRPRRQIVQYCTCWVGFDQINKAYIILFFGRPLVGRYWDHESVSYGCASAGVDAAFAPIALDGYRDLKI